VNATVETRLFSLVSADCLNVMVCGCGSGSGNPSKSGVVETGTAGENCGTVVSDSFLFPVRLVCRGCDVGGVFFG
jgi:hypothetical protein